MAKIIAGEPEVQTLADPEDSRDEIEAREHAQADFLASLEGDDVVIPGPSSWFKGPAWGTPAWGAPGYRYRRMLEFEARREPPPDGARAMRMQADDYYRCAADAEEARQQKKRGKKGKRPKLDAAPAAPEPDITDFDRRWDGTLPSAIYVYRDEHKVPHTVVARWNLAGGDKDIRPYIWGMAANRQPGWVNQRHPNPVLYRLPEVIKGVQDGKEIVFLEGEKDVDGAIDRGLEEFGFVFTTTLGGAMNNPRFCAWGDTDYSPLSGGKVTLVPDRDGPGAAWCEGVNAQLRKLNGSCNPPTVRVGTIPANWYNGYAKGWGFGDPLPAAARDDLDILKILTDTVPFAQWKKPQADPYDGAGAADFDAKGPLPEGVFIDKGEPLVATEWLVKDMVLKSGTGLIIGQRGAGKTPIAIGLAAALAAAQSFFGRDVKKARGAIYFSAEGAGQIRLRVRAALLHLGIVTGEIPLAIIDKPHNLSDETERTAFIALCRKTIAWLKERFDVETSLVIVDTMIKAFVIEDENDNAKIADICKTLEAIGKATSCFALGVVHAGKNMTLGARGASAWEDNVDIGLFVSADRDAVKGICTNRALNQTKNRDGTEGPIAAFDLKLIEVGKDKSGEPFGAMAVEPNLDRPATGEKSRKPTAGELIFRDAFNEVAIVRKTRLRVGAHSLPAIEVTALREEFCKRYATGEGDQGMATDTKTKAFRRALASAHLLREYPRETRNGVEWIWSVKDVPEQ